MIIYAVLSDFYFVAKFTITNLRRDSINRGREGQNFMKIYHKIRYFFWFPYDNKQKKHDCLQGSCFSDFFGGGCSGTPQECLDCNKGIECERNSSLSRIGTVLTHNDQPNRDQPPSESFKCPIGIGKRMRQIYWPSLLCRPGHTGWWLQPRGAVLDRRRSVHRGRHLWKQASLWKQELRKLPGQQ